MNTYRKLSIVELEELEKEFVEYLVVNGITADDWVEMKKNENKKAENIITLFSDVVFEGIMRKVKFLDYKSPTILKSFQCLEKKMVLVALELKEESKINFLDLKDFSSLINNPPDNVNIYTITKSYTKKREFELFDMTEEQGCEISDGELFKTLCLGLS